MISFWLDLTVVFLHYDSPIGLWRRISPSNPLSNGGHCAQFSRYGELINTPAAHDENIAARSIRRRSGIAVNGDMTANGKKRN
jgi:hypothetical protein